MVALPKAVLATNVVGHYFGSISEACVTCLKTINGLATPPNERCGWDVAEAIADGEPTLADRSFVLYPELSDFLIGQADLSSNSFTNPVSYISQSTQSTPIAQISCHPVR